MAATAPKKNPSRKALSAQRITTDSEKFKEELDEPDI
jgi:hypothetical protein